MSDVYSQLKPAWHRDRLDALRAGQPKAPVHVQLILSDLCNQDCGFCAYRMSGGLSTELFATPETHNPNRQIPTEKALEILEDCAAMGVRAVQFTGGGEPTVHPEHRRVFAFAQALGLRTALVTNGVRLDPHAQAVLGMDWIRVSIDAGDAEQYQATRRVPAAHWSKVWQNVGSLAARYTGVLGIGFVVTRENWRGVIGAARLAKAYGAQNMRVGAVFSESGTRYYGSELAEIIAAIGEAKATCDGDGFEVIDLFGRRLADLEGGAPTDAFCGYQFFTVYIGGDLKVYRCCNTSYTRRGIIADLSTQRFRDAVLTREEFDARGCTFCQFAGQNRAINALLEQPSHVDFV